MQEPQLLFLDQYRGYYDGVAEVEWQINPDGLYYMDSDGYGETDGKKVSLFSYIDRKGMPLVKFRMVKDSSELKEMKMDAINKSCQELRKK